MKRKGFTLIELLAVIVILAIIALIATPTILGVIEKSKKESYRNSIYGIMESANIYLANHLTSIGRTKEIAFICNGINCSNEEGDSLDFKGTVPKSGTFYLNGTGEVTVESVYNGKYYANTVDDKVEITEEDTTLSRAELTNMVKELQKKLNNLEQQGNAMKNEINNIKSSNITVEDIYPVGSIYISTSNIDPSNLFNGTKWEIYGENRMLMGVDKSNQSEKTGGSSTVTLTSSNLPSHSHSVTASGTVTSTFSNGVAQANGSHFHGIPSLSGTTNTAGSHTHTILNNYFNITAGSVTAGEYFAVLQAGRRSDLIESSGAHSHTVTTNASNTSSNGQHSHVVTGDVVSKFTGKNTDTSKVGENHSFSVQNPYITVYMWKRIS